MCELGVERGRTNSFLGIHVSQVQFQTNAQLLTRLFTVTMSSVYGASCREDETRETEEMLREKAVQTDVIASGKASQASPLHQHGVLRDDQETAVHINEHNMRASKQAATGHRTELSRHVQLWQIRVSRS